MPLTTATRATAEELEPHIIRFVGSSGAGQWRFQLLCKFCTDLGTVSASAHSIGDAKALRKAAESLPSRVGGSTRFRFVQNAIDAKTSNQAMQRTADRSLCLDLRACERHFQLARSLILDLVKPHALDGSFAVDSGDNCVRVVQYIPRSRCGDVWESA
jgi:hypothetical protein